MANPEQIRTREDFAQNLTLLRESARLSVREVAKAIGLPASTVGDYFSGGHLPPARSPEVLEAILRTCGVTDDEDVAAWAAALRRVRQAPGPRPRDAPAPYLGLSSYQPEHSEWFVGRERLTQLLTAQLADACQTGGGLFAVVGPSGSGKSSLLRAGMIAALCRGEVSPAFSQRSPVVLMTPGARPMTGLAARMAEMAGVDAARVEAQLRSPGEESVNELVSDLLGESGGIAIVVDQFEEVFTACEDEGEREAFIAALDRLHRAGTPAACVLVVVGLRADFYGHALLHPLLVPALQQRQVVVGPMTGEEIRRVIEEPARKANVAVEKGLVELLLTELAPARGGVDAHDPGALPLLSHALLATWERRQRGRMTVAGYIDSGGIRAAVAHTAEAAYNSLTAEQQELARWLFLRLVRVAPDMADTRRRMPLTELTGWGSTPRPELYDVLDTFADHRLLTVDADHVEITHEAVLVAWPRLREWIDADRAGLRIHRQLADAAAAWRDSDHDVNALYRGTRLAAASEWANDPAHVDLLNPLERSFLDRSLVQEATEREAAQRRTRRLAQLTAALAVLALVATTSAAYAFVQRRAADHARNLAISRQIATTADELRANDPNLAAQLALAAYRIEPTVEARSSMLQSYAGPALTRLDSGSVLLQAVAASRDGELMAAAGAGGTVTVWELSGLGGPAVRTVLTGHSGTVFALAFSPEGQMLASAGEDGVVMLWDLSDPESPGQHRAPADGEPTTVYALAFSPDGGTLAAGSFDGQIRLWRVGGPGAAPTAVTRMESDGASPVKSLAFTPDGATLAAGTAAGVVQLWDVSVMPVDLRTSVTGPTNEVFSLAFTRDGHFLVAGSKDTTVWTWDTSNVDQPVPSGAAITGAGGWVNAVAVSPDGSRFAAGGSDGFVRLYQSDTRQLIREMPHPSHITSVAFTPDGGTLATAAADGRVRLWSSSAPEITTPGSTIFAVMFGPGERLALAGNDNAARIWDLTAPRRPVETRNPIVVPEDLPVASGAAALSPDGTTLALGCRDGTVQIWDVNGTASRPRAILTGPTDLIQWLAFSPDGGALAAGSNDHNVWLWDLDSPSTAGRALSGHTNYVYSVAFSPDGRTLASGSIDSTVRLWDVSDLAAPAQLGPPLSEAENYVNTVAFSPDGRLLASGDADNNVWLWDVTDRTQPRQLGPLAGPHNYVLNVAFSRDSRTVAASGGDGTLWLWDIADPRRPVRLAAIDASTKPVYSIEFSAAGSLASGGSDGTVRIWHTDPEAVAAHLCSTVGDRISESEWQQYVPDVPYQPACPPPVG
ncbi:MAG TPA: helix-turn-helix domain-containing protein [Micromonosporaceae bacterium]|nr:helix-turn-helix domain-containing protein [Micromonosporaceae bacterium]